MVSLLVSFLRSLQPTLHLVTQSQYLTLPDYYSSEKSQGRNARIQIFPRARPGSDDPCFRPRLLFFLYQERDDDAVFDTSNAIANQKLVFVVTEVFNAPL